MGFARYIFPFHFTSTVLTFPFFPFLFICPATDTASYLIFGGASEIYLFFKKITQWLQLSTIPLKVAEHSFAGGQR